MAIDVCFSPYLPSIQTFISIFASTDRIRWHYRFIQKQHKTEKVVFQAEPSAPGGILELLY